MTTLLRRLAAAAAVLLVASAAMAGIAAAHASLLSTTPADGQSVSTDPGVVTATFSEQVSVDVGGLSVRNRLGERVEDGSSTVDGAGTTVSVRLRPDLPDGTYVATYRVLSADGHPVSGSWLFGIGAGELDTSAASAPSDNAWEVVGAVARFVTYLGALVAAGVAFFLALLHDRRPDRERLARIVRLATPVALVGIIGTIVAQAALLTGKGFSAASDLDVLRSVLSDRLGWSAAVMLLGLAALNLSTEMTDLTAVQTLAIAGGLAVAGSCALWGHDTEAPYRWVAVGSDLVHVGAAAVWLGGLVGLTVVLTRRPPYPVATTARIVGRFSTAAAISVLALLAGGFAMTWIELGSLRGLWETTYGRLVLAKLAATAGILVLAALNRLRIVPAIVAGADEAELDPGPQDEDASDASRDGDPERARSWQQLRRTVAVEALAIVAVLGITAVLVNTTPSRTVLATATGPVSITQTVDTGTVTLDVDPAEAGRNTLHIQYLDAEGSPLDISPSLTIEFSLPAADLGPIERQVVKLAAGHFVLEGDELSLPGTWTITLGARTSTFVEQRTPFEVPVSR